MEYILRDTYYNPNKENTEKTIKYLSGIYGNKLSIKCIREYIFKIKFNKNDSNLVFRSHLQAAALYLSFLIDSKTIENKSDKIKMVIAEILPNIKHIDKKQETSFVPISTNNLPHFAHYLNAQNLFYQNNIRRDYQNNYDCDVLVLYALRLTLEKRIKGIIGIDYINGQNGKPIGLAKLIEIVKSLKSIEFCETINWIEINLVNHWLNHYIHRILRPYPWVIHQAFDILDNLFNLKEIQTNDKKVRSWYGSAVIKNKEEFEKELNEKLEEIFPKSCIKKLESCEIIII